MRPLRLPGEPHPATTPLSDVPGLAVAAGEAHRHLCGGRMIGVTLAPSDGSAVAKRHVNRMIRETVPSTGGAGPVGFFCECADPGCHKVIWLTVDAFDRSRSDPDWHALAPGHAHAGSEVLS